MRAMLALMWLLHWLPLPILGRIGKGIGSLLFVLLRHRRHIALTNLRLCLPDLGEEARVNIARAHFQGYARSVLERGILWWASPERLRKLIRIVPAVPKAIAASRQSWEDAPRIEATQAAQRRGIFLNPQQSNPGKVNTVVGALAGGTKVNEVLAKKNAPTWTTIAKEDMNLQGGV